MLFSNYNLFYVLLNINIFASASPVQSGQYNLDSLKRVVLETNEDTAHINNLIATSRKLYNSGNYNGSLEVVKKAKVLTERIISIDKLPVMIMFAQKELANAYTIIGDIASKKYNYPLAIENYFTSLKTNERIGNKSGIASSYKSIGSAYFFQGNYSDALKNYFVALKIWEGIGDKKNMAESFNAIGNVYYYQDNNMEAQKNYFASLKIGEEIGDKHCIAQACNNIGLTYNEQFNFSEALKINLTALKLEKEIGDTASMAYSYHNIGEDNFYLGNYDEAFENYISAVKIWEKTGYKRGLSFSYRSIGDLYTRMKKFAEARNYLDKGMQISQEIDAKKEIKDNYYSLSILDSAEGNYRQAYQHYKDFIIYRDSLINEKNMEKIAELGAKYENEKKEKTIKLLTSAKELSEAQIKSEKQLRYFLIIGCVFIIGALFLWYSRYRESQKLELEKQLIEFEQKTLRSQMNPHFIFHSMNSIQSYIVRNDSVSAGVFLSRFARLIRNVLSSSGRTLVILEDEIHMMEDYLELEKLRFQNKFDYTFYVQKEVDPENIEIPSMLIQPYIENAVIHGISSKVGEGRISINFSLHENKLLICEIEDNGIGRKKAKEIRAKAGLAHQSLAMSLTKERLEILNRQNGIVISVDIIDLVDSKEESCGTRILLRIPYKEIT